MASVTLAWPVNINYILYYPPQAETITYLQCGIHIYSTTMGKICTVSSYETEKQLKSVNPAHFPNGATCTNLPITAPLGRDQCESTPELQIYNPS